MGSNVFANMMEFACVASDGKSIAAMPDVCYTPPQAPPTPTGVPIPYPNTGMASDLTGGSTSVMVGGDPICLKDKSSFKKTSGDEAGSAPLKGLVSMSNAGAVFFAAWSMDVKVEEENVVRNLDIGTHNHASQPGNSPPWPFVASLTPPKPVDESKCELKPYSEKCPEGQTPHHAVPDHCFKEKGRGGAAYPGKVEHADGLCICVKGEDKNSKRGRDKKAKVKREDFSDGERGTQAYYRQLADHGRIHNLFDNMESELGEKDGTASLGQLESAAAECIAAVTGCDPADLKKQLRQKHMAMDPPRNANMRLRADPTGSLDNPERAMGTVKQATGGGMF